MWVTMETNESKVAFICLLILLESPEDGGTIYQLENNGEGGSLSVWGGVRCRMQSNHHEWVEISSRSVGASGKTSAIDGVCTSLKPDLDEMVSQEETSG